MTPPSSFEILEARKRQQRRTAARGGVHDNDADNDLTPLTDFGPILEELLALPEVREDGWLWLGQCPSRTFPESKVSLLDTRTNGTLVGLTAIRANGPCTYGYGLTKRMARRLQFDLENYFLQNDVDIDDHDHDDDDDRYNNRSSYDIDHALRQLFDEQGFKPYMIGFERQSPIHYDRRGIVYQ